MATIYVRDDGNYETTRITNPAHEAQLLRETFPDLGVCAGEDMLGELPSGERPRNYRGGVGPALGQVFDE